MKQLIISIIIFIILLIIAIIAYTYKEDLIDDYQTKVNIYEIKEKEFDQLQKEVIKEEEKLKKLKHELGIFSQYIQQLDIYIDNWDGQQETYQTYSQKVDQKKIQTAKYNKKAKEYKEYEKIYQQKFNQKEKKRKELKELSEELN